MINPYLAADLRRASRFFARAGQPWLAHDAHAEIGKLADTTNPDESNAHRFIRLAFGDPIDA